LRGLAVNRPAHIVFGRIVVSWHGRSLLAVLALVVALGLVGCPRSQGKRAGWTRIVLQARPERGQQVTKEVMDAAVRTVKKRIDTLGERDAVVYKRGQDQIVVELPDMKRKQRAIEFIQETGDLEFWYMKNVGTGRGEERNSSPRFKMEVSDTGKYSFRDVMHPADPPITSAADIREKVIGKDTKPVFTGRDFEPETTCSSHAGNSPAVFLVFKDEAQKRFTDFTRKHVREYLGVTFDGKILTVPLIQDVILTNPVITGFETLEEAQRFTSLLNAGALPVPLEVVE